MTKRPPKHSNMTKPPPHLHEARDAGRSPRPRKLLLYYIKYNVPLLLSLLL